MIYAENILICIAVPFLISYMFVRGKVRQFILSFLIGMAVCLLGAYISGFLGTVAGLGPDDTAIFISPMVEEALKFLPFLFYLFMFDPSDASLFLEAIGIGVGFALFENCCYILTSGASSLIYIMIRGMAVGVMHIVSMLALCFGLTMARRLKVLTFSAVLGALSLSMIFHAVYNLLVSKPGVAAQIGYALPVVTAMILYIPYQKLRAEEPAKKA